MSRKFLILTSGVLLAVMSMQTAHAGWEEFHHRCVLDFHRNSAWPQPWINHDRIASCHIFDLMRQNGWCQQSTLTAFHFDPNTDELTEAGRMKVQQILLQHPQEFRTLFVVTGNDEKSTANRVDSVQNAAALFTIDGTLPEIRRVYIPPRGWPAEDIATINTQFQNSMPAPRLPQMNGAMTTN